jgi:hypothetical protein
MGTNDLVQALMSEGVEFATDGERIRWRYSEGRMTPEIVAQIAGEKSEVIDFLTRIPSTELGPIADKPDPEVYLAYLRAYGPTTHGAAAFALAWGATRTRQAEARLRAKSFVRYSTYCKTDLIEMESEQCK